MFSLYKLLAIPLGLLFLWLVRQQMSLNCWERLPLRASLCSGLIYTVVVFTYLNRLVDETDMEVVFRVWLFCLGLVMGSFFNVVIYRLPRGMSLVKPGSHCPQCGHSLRAAELIPVGSYLWQRGTCRSCGARIHWRYPAVELLTGVGFAAIEWTSSSWTQLIVGLVFFSILVVLAFIDLEHGILPNKIPFRIGQVPLCDYRVDNPCDRELRGAVLRFELIVSIVLLSGRHGHGRCKLLAVVGLFWAGRQCCMYCSGHLCWAALAAFVPLRDQERSQTPIWTKYGSSGCGLSSIPLGLGTVLRPKV